MKLALYVYIRQVIVEKKAKLFSWWARLTNNNTQYFKYDHQLHFTTYLNDLKMTYQY